MFWKRKKLDCSNSIAETERISIADAKRIVSLSKELEELEDLLKRNNAIHFCIWSSVVSTYIHIIPSNELESNIRSIIKSRINELKYQLGI